MGIAFTSATASRLPCVTYPLPPPGSQLPSRLQTLLKLKQEKEELAKLKNDPLEALDPDEASRRRLQEMRESAQPKKPAAKAVVLPDADEVSDGIDARLQSVCTVPPAELTPLSCCF